MMFRRVITIVYLLNLPLTHPHIPTLTKCEVEQTATTLRISVYLRQSALASTLATLSGNWEFLLITLPCPKSHQNSWWITTIRVLGETVQYCKNCSFALDKNAIKKAERVTILQGRITFIFVEFICRTGIAEDESCVV